MHSYDKEYLYYVQKNIGNMLDYAVNTCDLDITDFWNMFLVSDVEEQIRSNNPKFLVGFSGCELAKYVCEKAGISIKNQDEMYLDKSPEYWVGWSLAYYQWYSGKKFSKVSRAIPVEEIMCMYDTLHEADVSKFVTIIDEKLNNYYVESNLKRIRSGIGYSQCDLARESEVSLRQIQLFEQRQRDINKAQVQTVAKLAAALFCDIEELME